MRRMIMALCATAVLFTGQSADATAPDDDEDLAEVAFVDHAATLGTPVTHPACAVFMEVDEVHARCYGTVEGTPPTVISADGMKVDGQFVFVSQPVDAPPPSAAGTRADPIPLGVTADIGDGWSLTVNSVDLDAWPEISAANSFNDPPPDGSVYVMAHITASYNGTEDKDMGFFFVSGVTSSNVELDGLDSFVVPPDAFDSLGEVFQGGSKSGNIVLTVPAAEVGSLVLYTSAGFSGNDIYFATQ